MVAFVASIEKRRLLTMLLVDVVAVNRHQGPSPPDEAWICGSGSKHTGSGDFIDARYGIAFWLDLKFGHFEFGSTCATLGGTNRLRKPVENLKR